MPLECLSYSGRGWSRTGWRPHQEVTVARELGNYLLLENVHSTAEWRYFSNSLGNIQTCNDQTVQGKLDLYMGALVSRALSIPSVVSDGDTGRQDMHLNTRGVVAEVRLSR